MKTFVAAASLAAGATAAVLPRQDQCCFSLSASGGQSGEVGQLGDGQNRIGGSNPAGQYCLSGGSITDGNGRGCILTPPTTQFQCDEGATPDSGFSVGDNGELQHNGDSTFYACAADKGEYNIYTSTSGDQTQCVEITLNTGGKCSGSGNGNGGGASSQQASSAAPSAPAYSAPESSPAAPESTAPATSAASAPGYSAPAPSASSQPASQPASSAASSAPAYSAPGSSPAAPESTAPATSAASAPGYSAPAQSVPAPAPSVSTRIVTQYTTVCGCSESASAGPSSAPGVPAPSVPAPSETAPASSGNAPAPSESAPAPSESAPAPSVPAPSESSPAQSSAPVPSAPAPSESYPAQSSVPVPSESVPAPSAPGSPSSAPGYPAPSSAPAPSESAPAPSAPAPSESYPAQSSQEVPAPSGTPEQSSAQGVPSQTYPAPGQSSQAAPTQSAPAGYTTQPASGSQPAPSAGTATGTGSGSACQTSLVPGSYETPHLIVPVNSQAPDQSYGTSYNAYANGQNSTVFNFDIPQSDEGKTCSLVFLFPKKEDLETTDYTFNGQGSLSFAQLSSAADQQTTYNSCPSTQQQLGSVTPQAGNSYVVQSGPCAAGTTETVQMTASGGLELEFFEDWNPSPLGLFITTC